AALPGGPLRTTLRRENVMSRCPTYLVVCSIFLAVLAGVLAAPAPVAAPGTTWPLFRGNAPMTGVVADALPDPLTERWPFETKDSIEGAAAIVGDTVYVGSMDEYLYALDLANGNLKWKYKAGPIKAAPAVRDGAVYVGDSDGVFHCVDAVT